MDPEYHWQILLLKMLCSEYDCPDGIRFLGAQGDMKICDIDAWDRGVLLELLELITELLYAKIFERRVARLVSLVDEGLILLVEKYRGGHGRGYIYLGRILKLMGMELWVERG